MGDYLAMRTRICPVCKKEFIKSPYHIYKAAGNGAFVCSYSCMMQSRRRHEEKKQLLKEQRLKNKGGRNEQSN